MRRVDPEPGISRALALSRSRSLRNIRYTLAFDLPAARTERVYGRAGITFDVAEQSHPLVVDFTGDVSTLVLDGKPVEFRHVNGHLVFEGVVPKGQHQLEVAFAASDAPLNRRDDFLYTLFVPARAHFVFPCFDQPDLKARFTLQLSVPDGWTAVSNTRHDQFHFIETAPLPTYLFAFAAGRFSLEHSGPASRPMRIFHFEADPDRMRLNRNEIFNLHDAALEWLERYTAKPEPFGKLDVVLIPSFQFAGMEHPGAIYYNASAVLLDPSATENQHLGRASLIAHETSHLWFGDLVTMRWFDDVWLKEVFANLLASKIVEPAFSGLNHELRFLVEHYPAAYSVDRTEGTHPIRQPLANLQDAGDMYGPIIYHKAPIAMRELERLMTADGLRDGLREYLARFAFGSADWDDLVSVLAERTRVDVAAWSRAWIDQAGFSPSSVSVQAELYPLPYGGVVLSDDQRRTLLESIAELEDARVRGSAWIVLWEEMLAGRIGAPALLKTMLRALPAERTEQIVHLVLGYLRELFWRFTGAPERMLVASEVERTLRAGLVAAESLTLKATWFNALRTVASSEATVEWLERIWRRHEGVEGLALSDSDDAVLALELAVRPSMSDAILEEQRRRFEDDDRLARFEFVMPAASADEQQRDAFFERLTDVGNRRHERWVIEGLTYLNHPLRATSALRYLRRSLELLPEIRRTGDIFFPKGWLDAVVGGHSSAEAAAIIRDHLERASGYPAHLRRLVLQSADSLFRAAR